MMDGRWMSGWIHKLIDGWVGEWVESSETRDQNDPSSTKLFMAGILTESMAAMSSFLSF